MKYLSVCSGIEAATVAWKPLGWEAVAYSEIDPFCCSLLNHYYMDTPNLGNMEKYKEWDVENETIGLVCGGTPCQSFSVAGLRAGLDDPRGNLALAFLGIVDRFKPRWVLWENVPGVRSSWTDEAAYPPSKKSRKAIRESGLDPGDFEEVEQFSDFACFLSGLQELGYGVVGRSLDAQYFNVPQRRERMFIVGYLGDWRPAAAVLFEPESLRRDTTPSREAGERVAADVAPSIGASGRGFSRAGESRGQDPVVPCYQNTGKGYWKKGENAEAMRGSTGAGVYESNLVADTIRNQHNPACDGNVIAFSNTSGNTNLGMSKTGSPPITTRHGDPGMVLNYMRVRRLTPRECERLQGFPDDYTLIPHNGKPASDSVRYKALGNSMAVPVMRWIGERIQMFEGQK